MRVINIYKEKSIKAIYIGRGSIFGNPFKMGKDGNRKEVIQKYETYVRDMLEDRKNCFCPLRNAIYNLPEDAILSCFCKPLDCHGDIIIKIWKELHNES